MTATITLRDYQHEAHNAIMKRWQFGDRRTLLTLPTGGGKTVVFASIVRAAISDGRHRALVLAHTEELVDQAAKTLRTLLPGVSVGIVRAHHDQHDAQVIVATVQTLRSQKRISRIGSFGLIVIDEAHHAIAKTYTGILDHLGAFTEGIPFPLVLGVTATADRGDGKGLDTVFESIAYEVGIYELIQKGYLSDIRAKRVLLDLDLDKVKTRGGDFVDGALGSAMVDAGAPEHIAHAIQEHAADRKSIVFLPTVEMAERTAEAVNALGIRARSVSGQTPKAERQQIIDDVRSGVLQCITNCMVLTEGFDAPILDCAVMARPTSSRALYQQSAGRVLRPYMGKEDALILDMVGVTARHQIHSAASLIDALPDDQEIREGETATEAVARAQEEAIAAEETPTGRLVAYNVDVFHRSNLNWTPTGELFVLTGATKSYAIQLGQTDDDCELFRLEPEGYEYRAVRIADQITLEMAQGIAEEQARAAGFDATSIRQHAWRSQPPSEAQRRKLWAMGYRSRKALVELRTAGEASNLIASIMAENAIRRYRGPDSYKEAS